MFIFSHLHNVRYNFDRIRSAQHHIRLDDTSPQNRCSAPKMAEKTRILPHLQEILM